MFQVTSIKNDFRVLVHKNVSDFDFSSHFEMGKKMCMLKSLLSSSHSWGWSLVVPQTPRVISAESLTLAKLGSPSVTGLALPASRHSGER